MDPNLKIRYDAKIERLEKELKARDEEIAALKTKATTFEKWFEVVMEHLDKTFIPPEQSTERGVRWNFTFIDSIPFIGSDIKPWAVEHWWKYRPKAQTERLEFARKQDEERRCASK